MFNWCIIAISVLTKDRMTGNLQYYLYKNKIAPGSLVYRKTKQLKGQSIKNIQILRYKLKQRNKCKAIIM